MWIIAANVTTTAANHSRVDEHEHRGVTIVSERGEDVVECSKVAAQVQGR